MADQTATEFFPDDEPQIVDVFCDEDGVLGITQWGACDCSLVPPAARPSPLSR